MPVKRTKAQGNNESTRNGGVKRKQPAGTRRDTRDHRVNIGAAFDKWRAVKTAHELRSDADVALYLLNPRRCGPTSSPAGTCDPQTKAQMEKLIEQEVHGAVAKNETKLQGLIETVQQLSNDASIDHSIQKLEARINSVSRRTELALSYIRKTHEKSPLPSLVNVDIIRDAPEDGAMEPVSQRNKKRKACAVTNRDVLRIMDRTKRCLEKLCRDRAAFMADVADSGPEKSPPTLSPKYSSEGTPSSVSDLNRDEPPPVLSPNVSWMGHVGAVKKEECKEEKNNIERLKQFDPKENNFKEEAAPTDHSSNFGLKQTDQQQKRLCYPPLPANPFPSILNIEAASYSIPQNLEVNLALIRNPTRLSVLWNVTEEDPSAPPMESYSIFLTMEKEKGSNVFPDWHTYDKVEAKALPMCALIKKYKPGHKVCAAVVGKDVFGRYGPYSEVVTATIPD
ncbi:uncharacterized protein atf7ip2 isoform 1-T2 [Menidia menidia]